MNSSQLVPPTPSLCPPPHPPIPTHPKKTKQKTQKTTTRKNELAQLVSSAPKKQATRYLLTSICQGKKPVTYFPIRAQKSISGREGGTPNGAKAPGGYSPVPHNPACTMAVDKTATAARNTLYTAGNGTGFD